MGDTAMEGVTDGYEHLKQRIKLAVDAAEDGVESMIGKVTETFGHHPHLEEATNEAEEKLAVANDTAAEAVSEAETVIASDMDYDIKDFQETIHQHVENAHQEMEKVKNMPFEKIDESKQHVKNEINDTKAEIIEIMHIEDMDSQGGDIDYNERKLEEIEKRLPTPAHLQLPDLSDDDKEE